MIVVVIKHEPVHSSIRSRCMSCIHIVISCCLGISVAKTPSIQCVGLFEANAIQFGLDQLLDTKTDCLHPLHVTGFT